MSILNSTGAGLDGAQKQITSWLDRFNIRGYELNRTPNKPYWKINVRNVDVILVGLMLKTLPDYIVFDEIIGGNFICSYSEFTSMRGFPKRVGKNFDISFSKITMLDNAPILVDKDFVACGLPFTEEQIREVSKITCNVYL